MQRSHFLKKTGLYLLLATTVTVVSACAGQVGLNQQKAQIQGEVFYMNRMALPDSAQLVVSLEDVSLMDVKADVLAQKTIATKGQQVPIAFSLNYDPTKVKANHTYSLRASIKVNDDLLYTTTERVTVKLDGTDVQPIKVRVDPVGR